ncbi:hypothetical protein ACFVUZ_37230, partial [Kitasatospora sp. NPDC058060]
MTDRNDGDGRVIRFPRIGFGRPDRPAAPVPADPAPTTAPDPPAGPAAADRWAGPIARAELAAMATGTAMPVRADSTAPVSGGPAPAAPAPGFVPDTFLANSVASPGNDGQHQEGAASLVALSMAAVVGIAVSAMRGIHSGIASLRGDGKEKGKDSDESGKKKKKIQPAHEFGESAAGKNSDKKRWWNPFGSGSGKKNSGGTSGSSSVGSGGGKSGGGVDSGSGKKSDSKSGGGGGAGNGKTPGGGSD